VNAEALALAVDALRPHLTSVAVISARLVPVAFLCPLFGGSHAPTHVKLGTVLALACFLHSAAGIAVPLVTTTPDLLALVGRELVFGLSLGLIAALPFDIARMGGRFIDLFRGSSAEAALPMAGTKESATGDGLYHLLLALGCVGFVWPAMIGALTRSYALVGLGQFQQTEALALELVRIVGEAFATGFAIGAPVAALALAIDLGLGLASRGAGSLNLKENGAPVRILAGGAMVWLGVAVLASRLQDLALHHADLMNDLGQLAAGR